MKVAFVCHSQEQHYKRQREVSESWSQVEWFNGDERTTFRYKVAAAMLTRRCRICEVLGLRCIQVVDPAVDDGQEECSMMMSVQFKLKPLGGRRCHTPSLSTSTHLMLASASLMRLNILDHRTGNCHFTCFGAWRRRIKERSCGRRAVAGRAKVQEDRLGGTRSGRLTKTVDC